MSRAPTSRNAIVFPSRLRLVEYCNVACSLAEALRLAVGERHFHNRHLEHVGAGRKRAFIHRHVDAPGCRVPTGSRRSMRRSSDTGGCSQLRAAASATASPRGAMIPVRSLVEMNEIFLPSGENCGETFMPGRSMIGRSDPPSAATAKILRLIRREEPDDGRPRVGDLLAVGRPCKAVNVLIGRRDCARRARGINWLQPHARRRRIRADLVGNRRRRRARIAGDEGEVFPVRRPFVTADTLRRRRHDFGAGVVGPDAEDLRTALLRDEHRDAAIGPPPQRAAPAGPERRCDGSSASCFGVPPAVGITNSAVSCALRGTDGVETV